MNPSAGFAPHAAEPIWATGSGLRLLDAESAFDASVVGLGAMGEADPGAGVESAIHSSVEFRPGRCAAGEQQYNEITHGFLHSLIDQTAYARAACAS